VNTKSRSIVVKGTVVSIATHNAQDYISLSDMVRHFEGQGALIEQWLKAKDTVLFLGVWEQLNNPVFNSLEFEGIKSEAGRNSFFLSVKKRVVLPEELPADAREGELPNPHGRDRRARPVARQPRVSWWHAIGQARRRQVARCHRLPKTSPK